MERVGRMEREEAGERDEIGAVREPLLRGWHGTQLRRATTRVAPTGAGMDWGMGSRPRLHEGRLFAGTTEAGAGNDGVGMGGSGGDLRGTTTGSPLQGKGGGMGSRLRGNNEGGGAGKNGNTNMRWFVCEMGGNEGGREGDGFVRCGKWEEGGQNCPYERGEGSAT